MSASEEEIIVCYSCGAAMNVADVAPYSRVVCPECRTENRVKKQFGPYVLTRRHAIGGMSSVFVAKDAALDREVALKILSEEYSSDEKRITAFEEEARLTASFSHPNVVRVLTTGKAFGRFYIAMEFVPGGHFERQIRDKGQVPETEILPLAIQVAEGLKGAQAAGLIHRDVKPGNILLDSEGNAKIVDFGLALVTKGGTAKATEIWATPYYVPPEAIEGGVEDFRADIYAFGATLYHALAGKPPCDEESMATDILREAKKKIVPLKKAAPHLLHETCAVVDRAMAYEPAQRFGSYDEMIEGLKTALKVAHGEKVKDQDGVTIAERRVQLRARKRRNAIVFASGFALAASMVGTVILMNQSDPLPTKTAARALTVDGGTEAEAESPREIATRYASARRSMEKGDYTDAGRRFSSLLKDGNVQEPTRTWAGLEAVVVALMDGRMDTARKNAEKAASHLGSGPAGLDAGFVVGVMPVLSEIGGLDFFDAKTLALGESGNERFMGYLLAGLKNWEQGGIEQAVPFFQMVASEPALSEDGVLSQYQMIAKNYLRDYAVLTSAVAELDPKTPRECREAIEELNRQLTLLKTRGRARFNIRSRQIEFARMEKSLEKTKAILPAVEKVDVMAEIATLAGAYRFGELAEYVRNLKTDPPGCKSKSLLGIAEGALVFLTEIEADLAKKAVTLDLLLKDGSMVTSIGINPENQVVGKIESGEIRDLKWTDFPTDQLIELHREMVKNPAGEMERLRRHESAIAFEWLAGDRDRALVAASRLSEESEGFRNRWNSLADGLPK